MFHVSSEGPLRSQWNIQIQASKRVAMVDMTKPGLQEVMFSTVFAAKEKACLRSSGDGRVWKC